MAMAKLPNSKRGENDSEQCFWYNVFSDCAGGCEKKHEGLVKKQTFFYAKIDEKSTSTMTLLCGVSGKEETFYVANHPWHSSKAVKGDYVLFQASEKRSHVGDQFGRVYIRMPSASPSPPLIKPQVEVYTIDPDGTILHDDAYSIRKCKEKDCKIIGIHIAAVALQDGCQIGTKCIPCYPYRNFKQASFSLDKGKVLLAVSIYFHTKCEDGSKTLGPVLTQVRVKDNYAYSELTKFNDQLVDLWTYFAKQSFFTESKRKYIVRYPKTWGQRYVIEEMMMKFQSLVKKEQQVPCFITKTRQHYYQEKNDGISQDKTDNEGDTVVVSKKLFDDFKKERIKDKPDHSSVLAFVASSLFSIQSRVPIKSKLEWMDQYVVETLTTSNKNNVPCTSPGRQLLHYINQQIILNCLFGNSPLYSSEDLSGILGIRFRRPHLVKVLVKAVLESTFAIRYIDEDGFTPKVYEVPYKTFADGKIDGKSEKRKKIKIEIKLPCEKNFFNQDLVRFNSGALQSVVNDIRKGKKMDGNSITDEESFVKLSEQMTEEKSPYEEHKDGTLLIVQPGAELHLQISHADARDENKFGLRLLKIGIGCHFCITHIHHADLAFMSERRDIRELISPESIAELRGATVEQKLADSTTLRGIQIEWKGKYYSGGTFCTDKEIAKGYLLCVRKDVEEYVDEEYVRKEYVWCCHGVVSSVKGRDVIFEVCTLMQPESPPDGTDFCVEIVKKKK